MNLDIDIQYKYNHKILQYKFQKYIHLIIVENCTNYYNMDHSLKLLL